MKTKKRNIQLHHNNERKLCMVIKCLLPTCISTRSTCTCIIEHTHTHTHTHTHMHTLVVLHVHCVLTTCSTVQPCLIIKESEKSGGSINTKVYHSKIKNNCKEY